MERAEPAHPEPVEGRANVGLPAAIVLLAFVLRVTNLGGQSLWYDEAFSLLLARDTFPGIVERTARDTMPPLYYWLLHLWGLGPPVDSYPRFLSCIAGTLSVALVYPVTRSLLGAGPAVAAGLFAAVSPFHLFYSQEVRMYALLGLWNLLAAWGFIQGWFRERRLGWLLFGAGTLLSLYTHALGWLPSAAFVLWGLAAAGPTDRRRFVLPVAALAAAGALYLPWGIVLASQVSRVLSTFWAAPPSLISPFLSLYLLFEGPFAGGLFPIALSAVLLGLALTVPLVLARRPEAPSVLFLWVWSATPLLTLLALSLVRPIYLERVVIGAGFPVYILLGWSLARGAPRWAAGPLALVALLGALWGVRNWYADPAFAKPPYRDAAALVESAAAPGDPVLHTSDGSYLPFLLYAPGLGNRLLTGDPEAAEGTPRAKSTYDSLGVQPLDVAEAVGSRRRFFLVVALDHSLDYQRAKADEIDRRYARLRDERLGGIVVREYER